MHVFECHVHVSVCTETLLNGFKQTLLLGLRDDRYATDNDYIVEPFVQGHGISVALIRATMIAHILCLDVRVVQVVHHAEQTAVTMAALFLLAYCHVVMISQTLELFCRSVAQRCLLPSTMGKHEKKAGKGCVSALVHLFTQPS